MSRAAKPPYLCVFKRKGKPAVWAIRWTEPGRGGQKAETGALVADPDGLAKAEIYFEEWKRRRRAAATATAAAGPGNPHQVTVSEVIAYYIRHKEPDNATGQLRKTEALRPVDYFCGSEPVSALSVKRSREYVAWRRQHSVRIIDEEKGDIVVVAQKISEATVRKDLGALKAAINFAVEEELLPSGLIINLKLPPSSPPRERWLTLSEARRLLSESRGAPYVLPKRLSSAAQGWRAAYGVPSDTPRRDPRVREYLPLFVRIALYTGARCGAILDLKWPQIDLVNDRINFNQPGRKQSKKLRAVVPIPSKIKHVLLRAQASATTEYVIACPEGERIHNVRRAFNAAVKRAGLSGIVTTHTLRHTAASWLAQRGVPMWEIAKLLGHADSRITEKVYVNHTPGHLENAKLGMDRRGIAPQRRVG